MNKSFPTLTEALRYVEGLLHAGVAFQASRLFSRRFKRYQNKRRRMFMLIGVSPRAEGFCEKIAPGGQWGVEIKGPGESHIEAGILSPREVRIEQHCASAWYSRYLPYAYAMMKAEWDFRMDGIDFESINSYYGTCMGFAYLGQGNEPGRICAEDVALYDEVYSVSTSIKPPSLPFDEVYGPALAYVALFRPELVADHCEPDNWQWKHVCEVLEEMGKPVPQYKPKPLYPRRKKLMS
jgi:hypothetical protein